MWKKIVGKFVRKEAKEKACVHDWVKNKKFEFSVIYFHKNVVENMSQGRK